MKKEPMIILTLEEYEGMLNEIEELANLARKGGELKDL